MDYIMLYPSMNGLMACSRRLRRATFALVLGIGHSALRHPINGGRQLGTGLKTTSIHHKIYT